MKTEKFQWSRVAKRRARCWDGFDLGRVQEINARFILTVKGIFKRERFCLPRDAAQLFDGSELWFAITAQEAEEFRLADDRGLEAMRKRGLGLAQGSQQTLGEARANSTMDCFFCALVSDLLRAGIIEASDSDVVRRHAVLAHGVSRSSLATEIRP
jgi:hypothetical protein